MALETLTDKIPQSLQKQVGPFPLWVWVGGIAGGLVLYTLQNRGKGGTNSGDTEPQDETFDFESLPVIGGPTFDNTAGSAFGGATGTNITQDKRSPRCSKGYKASRNTAGTRWVCKRVKKPSAKKGYHLVWDFKSENWGIVKNKSFTLEEPHMDLLSAPNGASPTISTKQLSAIGIASPDKTPRAVLTPLNSTLPGATDLPFIAPRTPPTPISRTPGRPFHGSNIG